MNRVVVILLLALFGVHAETCSLGQCPSAAAAGIVNPVLVKTSVCDVVTTWWGGNSISCVLGTDRLSGFEVGENLLLYWTKPAGQDYSVTGIWGLNSQFIEIIQDSTSDVYAKFKIDSKATSSLQIGFTISRDNSISVFASTFSGFEAKSNTPKVVPEALTAATTNEDIFAANCGVTATFSRGNTVQCALFTVRTDSYPAATALVVSFKKPKNVIIAGLPWSLQTDPIHFQYVQDDTTVTFAVRSDWAASRYLKLAFQVFRANDYVLQGSAFSQFTFKSSLSTFSAPSLTSETTFSNVKSFTDLNVDPDNTPTYFKITSKLAETVNGDDGKAVTVTRVSFRSFYLGTDLIAGNIDFKLVNYKPEWPVTYLDLKLNQWSNLSSTTATTFQTDAQGQLIIRFATPSLLDVAAVVMDWKYRIPEDPVYLLLKTEVLYELQRVDQDLVDNSVNQQLRSQIIAKVGTDGLKGVKQMFERMTKDFLDGDACGNSEVYVSLDKNLYTASPLATSKCATSATRFRGLFSFGSIGSAIAGVGNSVVSTVGNGISNTVNSGVSGVNSVVSSAGNFVTGSAIPAITSFGGTISGTVTNLEGVVINIAGTVKDVATSTANDFKKLAVLGYTLGGQLLVQIADGLILALNTIGDAFVAFGKMIANAAETFIALIELLFNQGDVRRTYRILKTLIQLTTTTFGDFFKTKSTQFNDLIENVLPIEQIENDQLFNEFQKYMPKISTPGLNLGIFGDALNAVGNEVSDLISGGGISSFTVPISFDDFVGNSTIDGSGLGSANSANFPLLSTSGSFSFARQLPKLNGDIVGTLFTKSWDFLNLFSLPNSFPFNYINVLCKEVIGDSCSLLNVLLFAAAEVFTVSWKAVKLVAPFAASDESYFSGLADFKTLYDLSSSLYTPGSFGGLANSYFAGQSCPSAVSSGIATQKLGIDGRVYRKVSVAFSFVVAVTQSIANGFMVYFKRLVCLVDNVQPRSIGGFDLAFRNYLGVLSTISGLLVTAISGAFLLSNSAYSTVGNVLSAFILMYGFFLKPSSGGSYPDSAVERHIYAALNIVNGVTSAMDGAFNQYCLENTSPGPWTTAYTAASAVTSYVGSFLKVIGAVCTYSPVRNFALSKLPGSWVVLSGIAILQSANLLTVATTAVGMVANE